LPKRLIALVFACTLPFGIKAQQSSGAVLPTGTIDGSVNPEGISDVVAFRLFFSVVAESRPLQLRTQESTTISTDVVASSKQKAKLTPVKLSQSDQALIVTVLAGFKSDLQNVMASPPKSLANAATQSADQSMDSVTQNTINLLRSKMTPDGFERLQAYVREEKQKMKIIPLPQMTHARNQSKGR